MANPYIGNFLAPVDQDFVGDLISDLIYDRGIGVQLFPREVVLSDPIQHEAIVSRFKESVALDVLIESSSGEYVSPNAIFSFGHGFGSDDNTQVFFDKRRSIALLGRMPYEGDVIYIREVDRLFEITDIDGRDPGLSGASYHFLSGTMSPYAHGEGTTHLTEEMADLSDFTDLLVGATSSEHAAQEFVSFDSAEVTFDHNRDELDLSDHEELFTFDSTFFGPAASITTFDSTILTLDDDSGITMDNSTQSGSNVANDNDIQTERDPNSDNAELNCQGPKHDGSASKTPFNFW